MYDLDLTRAHWRQRALGNDFVDPNVEQHYPPDLELEPVHLDIDLFVDVANATVNGKVTNTVKARRAGPSVLKLNAVDFEDVDACDPDGNSLTWHYDGSVLTLQWAEPFATHEQRRAQISYRVTKPVAGLYFSKPDDAYPNQPWYAASDSETELARHWLPCIDLPNVRTRLDFHLRAESRFTILANGLLLGENDHADGTKTARWRLEQLCPSYLICIAVGDFVRADDGAFDDGEKSIEIAYFCTRDHTSEDLLRSFGRTGEMMAWMTEKFDQPFPYPKYYQFAVPGIYGAMENISLVSWHDHFVQDETLAQEISRLVDAINVHEMAHSYFGDAVVCRDFAHAWLKESWATYIDQCWHEDRYGQDEALYIFYDNAQAYFKEADERYARPIVTRRFKSSWQLFDAHLYPGGACRLHTLRKELGDQVFWAGVRDYLKRYHDQVVETDDFRHVLEEHSGRALGKFFDQWFHTAGYPSIKVTFRFDDKRHQGTFEIEQTQVDKEEGIPAFALSTDLAWTIDGVQYSVPLVLEKARHTVTVPMPAKPEQVRFDPDCRALYKLAFNPGDPMLRAQLTQAKDVIGRILAARELAKTAKRANIQAIVDAYASETFWGARVEFARALGEANTEAAVAGLAHIIALETDPMVLASIFKAAGNYRDLRIRDAIAARLRDGFQPEQPKGLPYLATSAAYQAMGKQRQDVLWDVLAAGAQRDSFNGLAQSGAFRGVAGTRRNEAIDLLMEKATYGASSNRARAAAVEALADIGQGQEKITHERIVEKLVDLLRDPWRRVGRSSAFGLSTIKAPAAIAPLQAYARTLAHQDRVSIERVIQALRQDDKLDGSAIKKQVQDLQEKVRKVEDQLQKLQAHLDLPEPESNP